MRKIGFIAKNLSEKYTYFQYQIRGHITNQLVRRSYKL